MSEFDDLTEQVTGLHVEVARALAEDAGWTVREVHSEKPAGFTMEYREGRVTLFCTGDVVDRIEHG